MKKLLVLLIFLFGFSAYSQLSEVLFESQDFLFDVEKHDVFLKDKAKFWLKSSDKPSHYFHRTGESILFIDYLAPKKTRVTKVLKQRPAKLKSLVIKDNKIESIYLCEIRLAPGIFAPSGIKSFYCHFMSPKSCEILNKIEKNQEPALSFAQEIVKTLPEEKKAYSDIFIPTFKFLLSTDEVNEDDFKIKEYRDSYRSLCMGLRLQIGEKVRFKYDQDADYEERVCLDHAPSLIDNKSFKMTHKKYCESYINNLNSL